MSRGSISSWQDYGRRSSQSMPQFSGGPVQFMTIDEYKKGNGWFLSYSKIAAIIVVFVIGIIAAGFLGWYINSLPKDKPYNTMDLLNDEIEDIDSVGEPSILPFIHPLSYRLELTPTINFNGVSSLYGSVVIEFHVNDGTSLSKLSLNAKNITVTSYKLLLLGPREDETRLTRRRRRIANNETNYENDSPVESDVATIGSNETLQYEQNGTYAREGTANNINNATNSIDFEKYATTLLSEFSESGVESSQYEMDDVKETFTIYLKTGLKQGTYLLKMNYQAWLDKDAFFLLKYNDPASEKWLMGTKLKRVGARSLMPIFDDAGVKSLFSVSVARPKEIRVLSNMPLRTSRDTSNDTIVIDSFNESPPLLAHNLAIAMGHIEPVGTVLAGHSNVTSTFWSGSTREPEGIYILDKLDAVVTNLANIYSMAYSWPKLDLISLPPGIDESMGSPGLIGINLNNLSRQSLFRVNKKSPLVTKKHALKVLFILIAHQWLDELVNVNRTDSWMLEGSLLYFQHEIIPKIDLSLDNSNSFITDVQLQVMEIDGYSISRSFRENVNYRLLRSVNDEYAKGACLIRMLHGAINDTAFRNGYKKLVTRWWVYHSQAVRSVISSTDNARTSTDLINHDLMRIDVNRIWKQLNQKYNATDAADFISILEEESTGLPPDVSLEKTINSWVSQGGYPLVTVIRNYEDGSAIVYQEQFMYDKPSEDVSKSWHIPLNYVSDNSSWSFPENIWFDPDRHREKKLLLDNIGSNESWLLFNVNKTGYYRVHYDERNWMLLKIALEENLEQFPPETRASLVDDVFSLATVGLMKYEIAFDFIKYMETKERHHLPWTALMRHMFKLNRLLYETSVFTDFQEFVVKFVSPLYSEVGTKLENGCEITMIAIKMACVFEHPECLDWSKNVFENAKTDHEIEKVVPSYIREMFYCTVARYGTRKEWNYFTEMVTITEDEEERKRLLSSFACFQAPWILQSILNEIVHEDRFQDDEISVILNAFPRNPAAAQVASRFVRANWQDIAQRFMGSYTILKSFVLSMVNGLTSEQDLEDLQIFRENNYDSMKGARYAAALVEASGNFVTSWLKNSLPEIEKLVKNDTVVSHTGL